MSEETAAKLAFGTGVLALAAFAVYRGQTLDIDVFGLKLRTACLGRGLRRAGCGRGRRSTGRSKRPR